jgi:hypothetical protein
VFICIFVKRGQNHSSLQSHEISICVFASILVGKTKQFTEEPIEIGANSRRLGFSHGCGLVGHDSAAVLWANSWVVVYYRPSEQPVRDGFQVYEYGVNQGFRIDITLTGVVSKSPAISQKKVASHEPQVRSSGIIGGR